MIIIYYLILAYLALRIGKIEKRVNVAMYSSLVSFPLALFTMIGLSIFAFLVLPMAIQGLLAIFLFIWKLHVFLKVKLLALIGGFLGTIFAFLLPFLGVFIVIATILFIYATGAEVIRSVYNKFLEFLVSALLAVRAFFMKLKKTAPPITHPVILLAEASIVCGLSAYSVWEFMSWMDAKLSMPDENSIYRFFVIAPLFILLYRNYLKDIKGGDGIDWYESPIELKFTSLVDGAVN